MLTVTTSWDDGDALDMRLAALLTRYGVKGTFYLTKDYRPNRLSEDNIRALAKTHEIGAHTLTHPDLRALSREQKRSEIVGSKEWLEQVLGTRVPMFCYPSGHVDEESITLVKEAGFIGARTTEGGRITVENSYRVPTTVQVYPFPFRKTDALKYNWRHLLQPYRERGPALRALGVSTLDMRSWQAMARAAFKAALQKGGVFHLWGHSWEIEKYGMWEDLESFLTFVSGAQECAFRTNGEVVKKV